MAYVGTRKLFEDAGFVKAAGQRGLRACADAVGAALTRRGHPHDIGWLTAASLLVDRVPNEDHGHTDPRQPSGL